MKYGFIGCGNMGGALARTLGKATKDVMISDPSENAKALARELGFDHGDNHKVVCSCDRVFLAVKPQMMQAVLEPLKNDFAEKKPLVITIAAGLEIARIREMIGCDLPIIRIMPNTPVAVGMGMIVYCRNTLVSDSDLTSFLEDMRFAGQLDAIEENKIDAASALSGSGPAFMYMMLEAMADGAVACGLPRDAAIRYAAATMAGAAQMVLETGIHPGILKDQVCSPGGSTIRGVQVLEEGAFRGTATKCIVETFKKNKELA